MKIAILTFQFAYNYGAMLQAFALKDYLSSLGNEVDVVPYFPAHLKRGYSVSPFERGISLKHRIYNFLTYAKRIGQARKFDDFKKLLITSEEFTETEKVKDYLGSYEMLVCGSDQIWNDKITGDTDVYFGGSTVIKKVAYAASLGSKSLDDVQKRNVARYLPLFSAVSVREETTKLLIQHMVGNVSVVCDPVFLRNADQWRNVEKEVREVKANKDFLLLYLLEENAELVSYAQTYARENLLTIYEIHPTLGSRHNGIKVLKNIGPAEFLYLMRNAKAICTNSFHAVSFSIIFEKPLLHIPNSKSPERTQNILGKAGIEVKSNCVMYDLESAIQRLDTYIDNSKMFIADFLQDIQY